MNAEGRVKLTSKKKKNRMSKLKNSFWKWEQKYVLLKFFSCLSISQNVSFWFYFEPIVQAPKTKVSLNQPSKAWKHRQTQNEKTHFSTCSWSLLSKVSLLSRNYFWVTGTKGTSCCINVAPKKSSLSCWLKGFLYSKSYSNLPPPPWTGVDSPPKDRREGLMRRRRAHTQKNP